MFRPDFPKARRGQRGFTLIELLVVIGLIGVLIAILSVALRGARENAKATQCSSNLRNIGLATSAYATENDNRLPYEDRGDENVMVNGRPMQFNCWIDVLHDGGYLEQVDADETSLVCPSVVRNDAHTIESYRMNSKLSETTFGQPGYDPHRRLDSIPDHSSTVGYFDGDVGGDVVSFKGRWRDRDSDVSYRHNTSTVITFLDWHVERLTKKEVDDRSVSNDDIIWQVPQLGTWDPSP